MHVTNIIPRRVWVHKHNGQKVSLYGAAPWVSTAEKENWELITDGFTWRTDMGTVGLCRVPAKTEEEAREVANTINRKRIDSLISHATAWPDQALECERKVAMIPLW